MCPGGSQSLGNKQMIKVDAKKKKKKLDKRKIYRNEKKWTLGINGRSEDLAANTLSNACGSPGYASEKF